MSQIDKRLLERVRKWLASPASFVREMFHVEPDAWQLDVLEAFNSNPRQVMLACKGPGKTCLLAWLIWYFLATRSFCRIAVLSISADTLRDTLWAELGKWQGKSEFLKAMFRMSSERIVQVDEPGTWWASARAFSKSANPQQQADTLSGLHEDNAMAVIDEAGGIPPSVLATAEAILAGGKDQHIVMAGNTTNQDSALGYAAINQRKHWHVTEITGDPDDPKRSPRVSKEWARMQIDAWGRDNPWVLVNVFGRFPLSGLNTLLSPDDVRDAQKRSPKAAQYDSWPVIMGVDVARFGDDESVFYKRQGKASFIPLRMRNLDNIQGASHCSRIAIEWNVDSVQIDATGGYGSAWYDLMKSFNHSNVLPVQFGGKAAANTRFLNKRAEIWWSMCDWVKDGGALAPIPEMVQGLSQVTYCYTRDGRIQLEEKDQFKARIGRSPDLEDALACTFAYPVPVQRKTLSGLPESVAALHLRDYDPWQRYEDEIKRELH